MSQSTQLIGPYDELHTHEKVRAQVGIPSAVYDQIFCQLLVYRGAQDKILSRLFFTFHTILKEHFHHLFDETIPQREEIVNDILNLIMESSVNAADQRFTQQIEQTNQNEQS